MSELRFPVVAPAIRRGDRIASLAGLVGGSIGLAAGLAEVCVGGSIRDWIGGKHDTTRLGLLTIALSCVALAAAAHLSRRHEPRLTVGGRIGDAVGLLVPGVIGFTTVGRLWYLPGVLLVAAGTIAAAPLRRQGREAVATVGRHWAVVLAAVLAAMYVFLGVTRLDLSGIIGVTGGLLALALLVARPNISRRRGVLLLVGAVAPFAVMTWWSVATPLIGVLLVAMGAAALPPAMEPTTTCRPAALGAERRLSNVGLGPASLMSDLSHHPREGSPTS